MKPDIIRTLTLLFFVEFALLLNFLREPYFVILGAFYMDNIASTIITLTLLTLTAWFGIAVFRQKSWVKSPAKYLAMLVMINSTANIIVSIFLSDDIAGYLSRVFEEAVFFGFILLQFFFVFINFWIYAAVKSSRRIFNR